MDSVLQTAVIVVVVQALFGGVLFMFRQTVLEFISKSVALKYDKKFEKVKSEFRVSENKIASELKAEVEKVQLLHKSTLEMHSKRNDILDAKRIDAIEKTYIELRKLSNYKMAVAFMKKINYERAGKFAGDENTRLFFKDLVKASGIDAHMTIFKKDEIGCKELYLSDEIISLVNAYASISIDAVLKLKALELGVANKELLKKGDLEEAIAKLYPTSKSGFEEHGESYAYYWYDHIYERLVLALRNEVSQFETTNLYVESSINMLSQITGTSHDEIEIPEELRSVIPETVAIQG